MNMNAEFMLKGGDQTKAIHAGEHPDPVTDDSSLDL